MILKRTLPLTKVEVRNWEFLVPLGTTLRALSGDPDPRTLLRRRSSLVVADLPVSKLPLDMKPGGTYKPQPNGFQEPDANSLLDSFGF